MNKNGIFYILLALIGPTNLADWIRTKFYENTLTESNLNIALHYALEAASYISGPFSLGFIAGALVFCAWDLPYIGRLLRKIKARRRNKSEDSELADTCDMISKQFFEHHTNVEDMRANQRWNPNDGADKMLSSWEETRKIESRHNENFQNKYGHQIVSIFVKLKRKGIDVSSEDIRTFQYRLLDASFLFRDLADSLRSGTYLEAGPFQIKRDDL